MKKNTGGSAFPNVPDGAGTKWEDWEQGMTLLDWFAGQALNGFMVEWRHTPAGYTSNLLANEMYDIASAMIAEKLRRENTNG